jgi:predicted DNA-binding transcriptional regulator AlpA
MTQPASPAHDSQIQPLEHTYYGKNSNGRFRVEHEGQRALVDGTLYRLRESTEKGKKRWLRKLVSTTPGYCHDVRDYSFLAKGGISGQRFRITGKMDFFPSKSVYEQGNALEVVESFFNGTLQVPPLQIDQPIVERRNASIQTHKQELELIAEQIAAGFDPTVRILFVSKYLGESRATLYRKMGKSFPMPIKRGKGSFWSMSQIDAYKVGSIQGVQQ